MRIAVLVFLALAGMLVAACTVSTAPACPEGTDRWVKYQLFMGRSNQTGEVVDDAAWATFLGDTVTPRFPDGLTVFDARGQWRDSEVARSIGSAPRCSSSWRRRVKTACV